MAAYKKDIHGFLMCGSRKVIVQVGCDLFELHNWGVTNSDDLKNLLNDERYDIRLLKDNCYLKMEVEDGG